MSISCGFHHPSVAGPPCNCNLKSLFWNSEDSKNTLWYANFYSLARIKQIVHAYACCYTCIIATFTYLHMGCLNQYFCLSLVYLTIIWIYADMHQKHPESTLKSYVKKNYMYIPKFWYWWQLCLLLHGSL